MAGAALQKARTILETAEFSHDGLEGALKAGAAELKLKARRQTSAGSRRGPSGDR